MGARLSSRDYYDKTLGCWIGKCIGGCAGMPFEGYKKYIDGVDFREKFDASQPNDDLDFQIMWLEVLKKKGPYFTADDLADIWKACCGYPFSEYGYFMKNYDRGIAAPYSGSFNNPFYKDGMGCPIRSEIWAAVNPGNPAEAARMAGIDASLDHADNAYMGEIFLAAAESLLFVDGDLPRVLRAALGFIDGGCRLAGAIEDILRMYDTKESFETVRQYIYERLSHPDFTNAVPNLAIIVAALLYGEGEMEKTITTALRCGFDADCTCATAGAALGILLGAAAIPEELKKLVAGEIVCAIDLGRPSNTAEELARESCEIGWGIAAARGGDPVLELPSEIPTWKEPEKAVGLTVSYTLRPAIGLDDDCPLIIRIDNPTAASVSGELRIEGLPEGFSASPKRALLTIGAGESREIEVTVRTRGIDTLRQTNILRAVYQASDGQTAERSFGIAGAMPLLVYGPFLRAADWPHPPEWPHCHGGVELPPADALVHNEVDESRMREVEAAVLSGDLRAGGALTGLLNAYEDTLPIEERFTIKGECGFLLSTFVEFQQDEKAWVVIGNTDAFSFYLNGRLMLEKDEYRLWTPINNAFIGEFRQGRNHLVIAIKRRTDHVRFSFGIKDYGGKHYHRTFWKDTLTFAAGLA